MALLLTKRLTRQNLRHYLSIDIRTKPRVTQPGLFQPLNKYSTTGLLPISASRHARSTFQTKLTSNIGTIRPSSVILPSFSRFYDVQQQCQFHTSPRRPIHPIFWMLIRPLGQITAIITGRYLRKWWRALPDDERGKMKKHIHKSRWWLVAAVAALVAAGALNYYIHIQETPLTGRKRFIAFTPEQFNKIVAFEFQLQWEMLKDLVVLPDHPAYGKILEVANAIVTSNQDIEFFRKQTWTVIVVDSAEENAFVLPTGHIFVFTGLLKAVQNEDQLAVVLGHEMAHAVLGHGAEQVSFAQMMDLYIIIVMAAIWLFVPHDGIALITQWFYKKVVNILLHLPYNRKLEREADEVGLQLIAKACFDVRESSTFWNLMAIRNETNGSELPPPEFLSTHPNHETRAQHLDDLVPEAVEVRKKCNCSKLPATDPRAQLQMLRRMMEEAQEAKSDSVNTPLLDNKVPAVAAQGS